jgi:hypothetical protein
VPDPNRAIDHRIRDRLASASADERCERVAVIVKLAAGRDPASLQEFGFQAGSVLGDLVTGTIALGEIQRLAQSDAVLYIEGLRGVQLDREPPH